MKLRRLMIGAVKSGSGKTTVTCGLLQAWKDQGKAVAACKCGPDYIDPMFHQRVLGIPSKNLDTFFTGEQETKRLLLQDRKEGDFVLLEGVMGLYDGLGGIREEGSSYHLAQVTKTPIVLLVDAKGMGRSLLPLLSGFLQYDRDHLIKGVILNRMSPSYYKVIGPMIEGELGLSVVGYVPDHKRFFVESRHLGLYMPHEMDGLKDQLCQIAEELKKTLSLEKLWSIGEAAEALEVWAEPVKRQTFPAEKKRPLIAVAMDEAFCFYYEDNLRLLEAYGASLAYVSPIHDRSLPKGCCGLLLGGGYPELYGEPLSQNKAMRRAIKAAIEGGMPAVAECGGFLYLHEHIRDREGHVYPMAGVLPADAYDTGKLVRFGYLVLEEEKENFLPTGGRIKGHEFHYFDSRQNGTSCRAKKPVSGREYPCVISGETCWMGFPHLYYPSEPAFAKAFVEKARVYGTTRGLL